MLDVLLEGLVRPLPIVAKVPRVLRLSVCTLEVADEDQMEIAQQQMLPGMSCMSQALVELDRSKGRY
jgi:hypothetical protein